MHIKERVALTSILASGGLTLAKGVVGVMTGSLAILSEAAHSLLDLVATIMTYFAVRISGKPADDEHHYGHGKVESVAALAETMLLFLLSGVVIWEAGQRLLGGAHPPIEATFWAFAVITVSVVVDFFRARLLYRVAAETSSEALEADALHFGSDMWSSLAVLVGLGGIMLGYSWADAAAAFAVAIFIIVAGWRLARRTLWTLTDTAPTGSSQKVREAAEGIAGVVSVDRIRARPAGDVIFVEVTIGVSRTLPQDRVASIRQRVAAAIRERIANAESTVHTEPRALDDETVLDRVMVIARNRALAIHHVTVHEIASRLSVSVDLEVDGNLSLAKAHEIADGLERAIAEELGPDVEVETHIEPLQVTDMSGFDASEARVRDVRTALSELAGGVLRDVHNVRVRQTPGGEVVNFHCRVDPSLTVTDVHERVDVVERGLRARYPAIRRVIGHAEPEQER